MEIRGCSFSSFKQLLSRLILANINSIEKHLFIYHFKVKADMHTQKNDESMHANLIHASWSILMFIMQETIECNSIDECEVVMYFYEFEKSQILIYWSFSIEVL